MDDFDDGAAELAVTPENVHLAVLRGCHARLVSCRSVSLDAMRRGFVRCEDLQIQLAALGPPHELGLVLQGKQSLSVADLLDCFVLPHTSLEEEEAAGFAAVGSHVPESFERLLRDEAFFGETERLALLRWCTALCALPIGGLSESKIKLRLYGPEVDDSTLPETHTCTREVHLPNYSSATVLREKLLLALQHVDDGFQKE